MTAIIPPRRYPNGRRKTTQQALNEIAAHERAAIVATATAQPHRRGQKDPSSPLLGTAIGRFVILHKMAHEIADAADVYGTAKRRWLALKGVPTEIHIGGSGADVDEEVVRKLWNVWKPIESAVATVAGQNALSLIFGAAVLERDIPDNSLSPQVKLGLIELAYFVGSLQRPK